MKLITKFTIGLLLMVLAGCSQEEDKELKVAPPEVLRPQLETLEKARQVNGIVRDEAAQQREIIDEQSQ